MVKFKDRHTYLGGSDAAAVCAVDPYRTPTSVWLEKKQLIDPPDLSDSDPVFWGVHLEAPIAEAAQTQFGLKLRRREEEFVHPEFPFMRAHIDRKVVGEKSGVEIKNVGLRMQDQWGESGTDQVPLYYALQGVHYMAVTGWNLWHFIVLIGGQDMRHYTLERDDDLIAMLTDKEKNFWECVEQDKKPDPINLHDVERLYTAHTGETIVADMDTLGLSQALMTVRKDKRMLEAAEDGLKFSLAKRLQSAEFVVNDEGDTIVTYKEQSRKSFDTDRFQHDHPDLYKQYLKVNSHRVMRIK